MGSTLSSRTLYSLKRAYPTRVVINRRANKTLDLKSGQRTEDIQAWVVDRAVFLPTATSRQVASTLSFVRENREFEYGKQYDLTVSSLIIDLADLPQGWEPLKDDYVGIDLKRYEIKDVEIQPNCFVLTLKALVGEAPYLAEPQTVISTLYLTDTATAVVS